MLIPALYATSTGLQATSALLDVVSNNIANSATTGFKTAQMTFQDLLSIGQPPGATANPPGVAPPQGQQIGAGVAVDAVTGLFTQGTLTPTNQQLDLAVTGQGFFSVQLPDGTTGYTRAGNLTANANGQLVTSDGFLLAGGITLPANAASVSIAADGTVTATLSDGTTQPIGNITLTNFQNPAGLSRIGDTTFAASAVSGAPAVGTPGANGLGTISQGFLEQSNVDLTSELVNLIVAQRTFQFNTQAFQVENQTLQATSALIQ
jgi:flagellar basal-body rod protein FlgG